MTERRTIVLYGNPVFTAEVLTVVQSSEECDIVSIDATCPDAGKRLLAAAPDVMIIELATLNSCHATVFFRKHPTIPLIGLDTTNNRVIVLGSQPLLSGLVRHLSHILMNRPFNRECIVGNK